MIQSRLQEIWYGGREPGLLLRSLEDVYRRSLGARRARELQRRARDLEARPIVVVGNINVGGTGKTPLVIRLCELLRGAGLKPGVVSRGYGRRSKGQLRVTADSPPHESGDEPVLIARRGQVPVVVDADREAAARAVFAAGADIVIADDGLQRWRLPRDIEICVMDGQRGFGNGHLLPAGPLREPVTRLQEVDYLVCTNGPPVAQPGRDCIPMHLEPATFCALECDQELPVADTLERLAGQTVFAVAGIGFPQRFFDSLASLGLKPDHLRAFDDHHAFTAEDFKDMGGAIVMTEKDAVKCTGLGLANAWYLRVDASLPEAFEESLATRCRQLVAEKG